MALKNGSFTGVGSTDILHLIVAFEEVNSCVLSMSMGSTVTNGRSDLEMRAYAYTKPVAGVEPALLGSSVFSLTSQGFLTLDSAIMFALYQLDFLLAAFELEKSKNTSA